MDMEDLRLVEISSFQWNCRQSSIIKRCIMAFVTNSPANTNADKEHDGVTTMSRISIKNEYKSLKIKEEKNNEDSTCFEVEVNYLPNLNVVRFNNEEIIKQGDEDFSELTVDNEDENDSDESASASTSIIDEISKQVFEKYKKLCDAIDMSVVSSDIKEKPLNASDVCSSNSTILAQHQGLPMKYQCHLCNVQFVKYGSLLIHKERQHSADIHYQCNECSKQFARVGDLNQHVAMHCDGKKYICTDCPKQFARSAGLRRHKLLHSGLKPHECEICLKRFSQSGDLKKHLMYHRGEKPYQCDICLKFFSQASNLNQHRKTHSGIRSFFCDVCFKVFQSNSNLKHHQLIHNAVKRYKCDVCHKNFIRGGDLKKHKIIHGGEKKFSCHLCQRPFLRNGDLKKHMAIHRDIVPQQGIEVNNVKREVGEWSQDETQLSDLQPNVITRTISNTVADVNDMQLWQTHQISGHPKHIRDIKIEVPE